MKKKSLLMTLLMLIGFSMANATDWEIGTLETGKLTNQFPTNPYFAYSLSQQIIPAPELSAGSGLITSISFYRDWTSENIDELNMSGLKLYMKNIDGSKASFSSETDMIPVEESDLVWTGKFSAPTVDYKGWVTIYLDKPFRYEDGLNLLICFYDPNPAKTAANTNKFYYVATGGNTSLTYFSNDEVPDLENIGTFSGNKMLMAAHNYLKFGYTHGAHYETVEVGDNKTATSLPTATNWNYAISQQIYTIAEIGEAKTINSISFYNTRSVTYGRKFDLYLVPTDKESFVNADDYISYSDANKVFSGEMPFAGADWTTIPFDAPYYYNGTQNLAVIMVDNTGSYELYCAWFRAFDTSDYQALYGYNDYNPITLSNVTSGAHDICSSKNQIRINEGDAIGTMNDISLPIYPFYKSSVSQQIYTPSELGYENVFSSISFYNKGAEVTRKIDLYLRSTSKTQFTNTTDGIYVSEDYKFFSGEVTFKQGEWTPIQFNRFFEYDGYNSVVVVMDDETGERTDITPSFLVLGATDQCLQVYSDESNLAPDYTTIYDGNLRIVKNQIRLNDKGLNMTPTSITISDVTYNSATVSWEGRGSTWNLQYMGPDDLDWRSVEGLTEPTCLLTDLLEETTYQVRVQGVDGSDLSDWATASFTTEEKYKKPTYLSVMETTPYSAILKWKDNCSASTWQINVYNNTLGEETDVEAGSNPFVLTGLAQCTVYKVRVRAIIDAENEIYSNWSEELNFQTPDVNPEPIFVSIDPIPGGATITWEGQSDSYIVRYRKPAAPAVPFWSEDFESLTTEGELPAGWTTVDADGDGFNWSSFVGLSGIKYHSGSACLYSKSYDTYTFLPLTPDNWLISPQLELKGTFSAWLVGQDNFDNTERFAFYVSTTGTDLADFVQVLPERATTGVYHQYTADLSAYEGQMGYIAIRHFDCTNQFYLNLDDLSMYIPNEPEPWVTVETKDKTTTLEGLEYGTDYEVQVVGVTKGHGDSFTDIYGFTTMVKNPAPVDITVNSTNTTADVKWTGYGDMYQVKYREIEGETIYFSEDFEAGDIYSTGWKQYTDGEFIPGYDGWFVDNGYAHGGSYSACSYSYSSSYGALHADNWLISPFVDLKGTLEYWELASGTWTESYEILLSTTGTAEADFTTVLRPFGPSTAQSEWKKIEIDLSPYEGQQGYIAFHHKDYDRVVLCIDDIRIFERVYGPWVTKYSTKPEITLRDLKAGTTYEISVTGQVDGEPDAESEIVTFTTKASEATDLALDNYGDNSSIIPASKGDFVNAKIEHLYLPDNQWCPICLPFDLELDNEGFGGAAVEARKLDNPTAHGTTLLFNALTPMTSIKAGEPCLIKVTRGDGGNLVDPVFKNVTISTWTDTAWSPDGTAYMSALFYYNWTCDTNYSSLFVLTDFGTVLSPLSVSYELRAFEAYFYYSGDPTVFDQILLNTGDNDKVTGISEINGQWSMDNGQSIYNLAGQRLNKAQKGINIINGKKVLVK